MTGATFKARGAYPTARALRSLLQELFAQSLRQIELLECEDYEALDEVLTRKACLAEMLAAVLEQARKLGWELQDPSTYPVQGPCVPVIRDAAELSTRLQAHEKYCLGEMIARKSRIGERLTSLLNRRTAAAGYRIPRVRGNTIDTER
ncbi:MAG TPA: hypothetical protein VGL38_10135 [bacterium]|jgi:hypothetical protein